MLPLLLLLACETAAPPPPAPVVLVVSLDTTRADAVGAWGSPDGKTPNIDALAVSGVRFAWALSPCPTTLAAHTAAFSGEDTHGSRVVRNGFPLPSRLPLLTERFASAGWDRIAVVGSAALEQKMGLDRGFRVYKDHAWRHTFWQYEVSAETVNRVALDEVDRRTPGAPLFLFVHYYDAHMPWDSADDDTRAAFVDPNYDGKADGDIDGITYLTTAAIRGFLSPADAAQARGHYLAEVNSVDRHLGRLLDGLRDRGMLRDSLVVLMADHGEVFDEEPARPYRHGPDVDLVATHVPLLIAGQGRFATPAGLVVERPVRLQDVGTTVASLTGLGPALGTGEDLSLFWRGGAAEAGPPAFLEATKPHELAATDRWPNLPFERAVSAEGHLLIRAPLLDSTPRLYRLDATQTPVTDDPERLARLDRLLQAWDAAAPPFRTPEMDDETMEGLKALGYLEGDER